MPETLIGPPAAAPMSIPAGQAFHVSGAAQILTSLGPSGALQTLGHSVNGVSIHLRNVKIPVYTDAGGGDGGIPATYQKLGQMAVISGDVIVYDEAAMYNVRAGSEMVTEGVMIPCGTVLDPTPPGGSPIAPGGTGNKGFYRLVVVATATGDLNWNFPFAHLMDTPFRVSTRTTIYRCTWEAFPWIGNRTDIVNTVLYNRVIT